MPTKLCKGCLKIIQEMDVKKDEARRKLPSFCEIGQLNGVQHILFNKEIRDKPGRPATATKENDLSGLLAIYKQTMRLTLLQEARKLMHQSSKTL